LYERGIHSQEELHSFIQPSLEDLHDPYLLHDMDKAVERIRRAIEDYEQILIYGDYDADGDLGIDSERNSEEMCEVQVYLPNRFTDGYGPNQSVYKYFIEQQGFLLL
jgi:single-stranded-DNA-specific exonuclease